MANTVNLEFAGDASKLAAAAKKAESSLQGVGKGALGASDDFQKAGKASTDFATKAAKLGSAVNGASTAIGDAAGTMQALVDIQQAGSQKSAKLARAQADVEQAMLDGTQAALDYEQSLNDLAQAETDLRQSSLDSNQAEIDKKQALLDASTATKEYNEAVKKHGKGSAEARQAALDLEQAQADVGQATLDLDQALNDEFQAQTDANQAKLDGAQAGRDAKDAQLNLNDAMREAHPPELQQWADKLNLIAPLLQGVVGVVALVTAAQWAWNVAQLASPLTWIILGIVALIAVIVLIATKTDWFQRAWRASWGWIKNAASNTWDFLKKIPGWIGTAFKAVANFITAPFRTAFNLVADAWNATVGRLSWTVPNWIPGIGGASISVPHIPKFHSGGVVPGVPGSETLAVLQAGERVSTRGGGGDQMVHVTVKIDRDTLLDIIAKGNRRGGPKVA